MTTTDTKPKFTRELKLAPAIGDWTAIKLSPKELEKAKISTINEPYFDSLPQEDMKYLHYFHYRLSEKILKKLSENLNLKTELHTILATQITAEDLKPALGKELLQVDIHIKSVGVINLVLDSRLSDMIIDRLIGGKGKPFGKSAFTNLEKTALLSQLEEFIPIYSNMWKTIFEPKHIVLDIQQGTFRFDKKNSPRDAYIYFTLNFTFGNQDLHKITWIYPNHIIQKLMHFKQKLQDPLKKRIFLSPKTETKIQVPITAIIGETEVLMTDLKQLQEGDIITLNSKITNPIEIKISEDIKLHGQPGLKNKKCCVQIINQETPITPTLPSLITTEEPLIKEEAPSTEFYTSQTSREKIKKKIGVVAPLPIQTEEIIDKEIPQEIEEITTQEEPEPSPEMTEEEIETETPETNIQESSDQPSTDLEEAVNEDIAQEGLKSIKEEEGTAEEEEEESSEEEVESSEGNLYPLDITESTIEKKDLILEEEEEDLILEKSSDQPSTDLEEAVDKDIIQEELKSIKEEEDIPPPPSDLVAPSDETEEEDDFSWDDLE